jgi:hypothetical protein
MTEQEQQERPRIPEDDALDVAKEVLQQFQDRQRLEQEKEKAFDDWVSQGHTIVSQFPCALLAFSKLDALLRALEQEGKQLSLLNLQSAEMEERRLLSSIDEAEILLGRELEKIESAKRKEARDRKLAEEARESQRKQDAETRAEEQLAREETLEKIEQRERKKKSIVNRILGKSSERV